jgi:uncharacterized membrane protein
MAFFIYSFNLIIIAIAYISSILEKSFFDSGFHTVATLITIILFIITFILKKACEDEYLGEHFKYQFRTLLIYLLIDIIWIIIFFMFFMFLVALFNDIRAIVSGVFLFYIGAILLVMLHIWFIYRNIKGIIYLITNKDL